MTRVGLHSTKGIVACVSLVVLLIGFGDRVAAQSAAEISAAKSYLATLQAMSFETKVEHCGVFGYRPDGRIVATRATVGTRASCAPGRPPKNVRVYASFHTHGGFEEGYDGEVPSVADVLDDMDNGVDGYIATPGGRLWFIDGSNGESRQICGPGCLPTDPAFRSEAYGPVKSRYTLARLKRREGG